MALFRRYLSIARGAKFAAIDPHRRIATYDPQGLLDRVNRTLRRRLSDRVEDAFKEACLSGDLDTAEELLTVLESMHARRCEKFGQDRRIDDGSLVKARAELAQRKAAVTTRQSSTGQP
jgi:hypothetical protein